MVTSDLPARTNSELVATEQEGSTVVMIYLEGVDGLIACSMCAQEQRDQYWNFEADIDILIVRKI